MTEQQVGRRKRVGNPKKDPEARRKRPMAHPALVVSRQHPDVQPLAFLTRAERDAARAVEADHGPGRSAAVDAFMQSVLSSPLHKGFMR